MDEDRGALPKRVQAAVADGDLIWSPAHCDASAIGSVTDSAGKVFSDTEWRANVLVDAAAKQAATPTAAAQASADALATAAKLARHESAVLGAVASAANGDK